MSLADTPVIGVVEGKIETRGPFTNFWTVENLHGSAFSLHATRGRRGSFLASNSTAVDRQFFSCKLYGPCKEHSEKEVSRKNSEGRGYGARAVGTSIMVLFNKSSFRYTRFWYTLWMDYFDSSCQHSKVYYPTRNAKWQRWDQQKAYSQKRYFVRWLAWPLCGLKSPLRKLFQLFIKVARLDFSGGIPPKFEH